MSTAVYSDLEHDLQNTTTRRIFYSRKNERKIVTNWKVSLFSRLKCSFPRDVIRSMHGFLKSRVSFLFFTRRGSTISTSLYLLVKIPPSHLLRQKSLRNKYRTYLKYTFKFPSLRIITRLFIVYLLHTV